jgi:thiol-disulfide isomerase/thioredoxin
MMTTLKKILIPITLLILLAALIISLAQKPRSPDVTFTTLQGEKITMESLKGKVVLVNFWATDCPGCIKEMPDLINTYNQYKAKGFEVVAVAMPYDPPAQVLNYSTQKSLPFPVMHDGLSEMVQAFGGVNLTPTTFLYDKQGNRLQRIIGELNFVQLRQLLDKELL